jgi:hypothetical protein
MQLLTTKLDFLSTFLKTSSVRYVGKSLQIQVSMIDSSKATRSYLLNYFHLIDDKWTKFSSFVSPSKKECLDDIKYELNSYSE